MKQEDAIAPIAVKEPTIVVGLGRFGLSVLEQLGETWESLRDATGDPRLANLRLLHLRGADDGAFAWRAGEDSARGLADAIGEGDGALRAVRFLFLRTLGLVRFHRGTYEVAVARDVGVTALGSSESDEGEVSSQPDRQVVSRRVRTFEWRSLSPDPIRAVELLQISISRDAEVDLFLSPFLERIWAGHSPQLIEQAIIRASHYAEGRDPAPWSLDEGDEEADAADAYRLIEPDDWESRVCDAGPRAPRATVEEVLRERGMMPSDASGVGVGHLGLPANRSVLQLDDELVDESPLERMHDQVVGGRDTRETMARTALSSTMAQAGSLSKHIETDRAIVGVGRASATSIYDAEGVRSMLRGLNAERDALTSDLRRTARGFAAWVNSPDDASNPFDEALLEGSEAPLDLERGVDLLRRADELWGSYKQIIDTQRRVLDPRHPDLRATLRGVAVLCRSAGGFSLERAGFLHLYRKHTLEALRRHSDVDASAQARSGLYVAGMEEALQESGAWFERALAALSEVLAALDGFQAHPGDPERLATHLAMAELSRDQWRMASAIDFRRPERSLVVSETEPGGYDVNRSHSFLNAAKQSLELVISAEEAPNDVDREVARARRLLAHHRLARMYEFSGDDEAAIEHLLHVVSCSYEEAPGARSSDPGGGASRRPPAWLRPEHRPSAAAHRIAAAHALGRIWRSRRDYVRAIAALQFVCGADGGGRKSEGGSQRAVDGQKTASQRLRPEHEPIVARHRMLAEHELATAFISSEQCDEAIKHLEAVIERRKTEWGAEHPETLTAVLDLSAALRERGTEADLERAALILLAVRGGHAQGSRFDPVEPRSNVIDPRAILEIPGVVQGWSQSDMDSGESYRIVALPRWLHGLYDSLHDDQETQRALEERIELPLRQLGQLCMRGLFEQFWELRLRERPPVPDEQPRDDAKASLDLAVEQSTDLIAEFLFRPLNESNKDVPRFVRPEIEAFTLPVTASERLAALKNPVADPRMAMLDRLDGRLAELGALPPARKDPSTHLFTEVEVPRRDMRDEYELRVFEVRRVVRTLVTSLLDSGYLSSVSSRGVGQPPRLTLFLVGDLGEPFVRLFAQETIQLLHAEILRAFTALFKDFRGGFDRNLVILPILWFPNPSAATPQNASKKEHFVRAVRHEEAVMLDALLKLRRQVNRIPNRDRFVPLVYVCSRVNDGAIVSVGESATQTHDFISMAIRSDLGSDEWLRSLVTGPYGRDFFATFGCMEIGMPAERIREYLAGRLARRVLGELLHAPSGRAEDPAAAMLADEADTPDASRVEGRSSEVETSLLGGCTSLADRSAGPFDTDDEAAEPEAVERRFSDEACKGVADTIVRGWPSLVAKDGQMDRLMVELRRCAMEVGEGAVRSIRERGDRTMSGPLHRVPLTLVLDQMRASADRERDRLGECDHQLKAAHESALKQRRPDPYGRLKPLFEEVRDAAEAVPDRRPFVFGVALAALTGAVGFGSVAQAVCVGVGLDRAPGILEFVLGSLGMLMGAVLAGLAVYSLLQWHRARLHRRMVEAACAVAGGIRAVVIGQGESVFAYLRSRVVFARALVVRRLASLRFEHARIDEQLAVRVRIAAVLAERDLRVHAEMLGVRSAPAKTMSEALPDDITGLLHPQGRDRMCLVTPENVLGYYDDIIGGNSAQRSLIPDVVRAAVSADAWRERVWFSERADLLRVGRARFARLLDDDACEDPRFALSVVSHIEGAYRAHAAQLGLPGYVAGMEGLDDDGIVERARSEVVMRSSLARLVERLGRAGQLPRFRRAEVRAHAAYLLTLVQGIAPHLPLLHRRYMGYHERTLASDLVAVRKGSNAPVHMLTGREEEVKTVYDRFVVGRDATKKT